MRFWTIFSTISLVSLSLLAEIKLHEAPKSAAGASKAPAASKESVPLSKEKMVEILRGIDLRIKSSGDYKALVYIEQHEGKKGGGAKATDKTTIDSVREALVYRRDADEKLMILFTKPKSEEGKGYLRIDRNLWYYDPGVGKWERRTDRERIAGTDSRRQDFDQSKLALEYDPSYGGEGKLGNFKVWILNLKAKPSVDVPYPQVKLWVDQATGNDLKRQDFAESGTLLRTSLIPKWQKLFSKSKNAELWYRQEVRIYDELDKENSTLVIIKPPLDLDPLDPNIFTKAWLESKSR